MTRLKSAALATVVFTAIAAVFLAPIFTGHRFTAVSERRADIYPWAAFDAGAPQPAHADEADLTEPWNHQMVTALSEGTLPLWNPQTFAGGSALYANGSSAALWPPRLVVSLFVPESWVHEVICFLHLVLWGLAMYALLREFGYSPAVAILGGALWELSSFNLGFLQFEVVIGIPIAIPLGALVVHRCARRPRLATVLGGGVLLGTVLLSGHLLWHAITLTMGGIYAGFLGLTTLLRRGTLSWKEALTKAAAPCVALATAPLAAAVVLIPTALTLANTPRTPFSAELVPAFIGGKQQLLDLVRAPQTEPTNSEVLGGHLGFIGTLGVILAIIGFFSRRPGTGWARGIVLGTLGVALWLPMAKLAYHLLPGFNVFYPYTRLLGWTAAGIVVAAAAGAQACWERVSRWLPTGVDATRRTWIATAAVGLAVVVTTAQMVPLGRALNPEFPPRHAERATFGPTPLIEAATSLRSASGGEALIAPITQDYLPTGPAGPPPLWANTATLHGLFTTSGYDSTLASGAAAVSKVADGASPAEAVQGLVGAYAPVLQVGRSNPVMLRRLGVTHLMVVPEIALDDERLQRFLPYHLVYQGIDGTLLALDEAAPGPWIIHGLTETANDLDSLTAMIAPEFDFSIGVWSPDRYRSEPPPIVASSRTGDHIESADRGRQSYSTTLSTEQPAAVVLPVNWDPGWEVTVNGETVDTHRLNVSRLAVAVPGGRSEIIARYRPPQWKLGLAVSLLVWIGWLFAAIRQRRGRRATITND